MGPRGIILEPQGYQNSIGLMSVKRWGTFLELPGSFGEAVGAILRFFWVAFLVYFRVVFLKEFLVALGIDLGAKMGANFTYF